MGMRGAAARLGLGLGGAIARDLKHHKNMMMIKKVSSSFFPILFIRKSSGASSSVTEKGGTGSSSDKWLYLYFNEHYAHENVNGPSSSGTKYPHSRHQMSSYLLSPTKTDYEHSKLTEAVRTFRNYNSSLDRNWAVSTPKIRAEESERFQVLDTTRKGRKKWLPLEAPPPLNHDARLTGLFPWPTFIGVPVGTKVLVWYPGREGAYCFDVTQPEKGWLETRTIFGKLHSLSQLLSPLFVEHEHEPGGNNHFLMFSFDPYAHDTVKSFSCPPNWDTFQSVNQPLASSVPRRRWQSRRRFPKPDATVAAVILASGCPNHKHPRDSLSTPPDPSIQPVLLSCCYFSTAGFLTPPSHRHSPAKSASLSLRLSRALSSGGAGGARLGN
ncbi:hypothetical protein M0R45_004405 [Rubus argutus]|uniref:Uncharacterized protein n=1 Tax=Rubus argutus TaxID=59490 RepID=A0AAW1YJL5_RUBAR